MTLKIDSDKKVITIIGKTSILEVLKFLEGKELSDWSIESEVVTLTKDTFLVQPEPYVRYVYPETITPPFIVTY